MRVRRTVRLVLAVALLGGQLLFATAAAAADITSPGPLTHVIVTPDLNCQVGHAEDDLFEFFPSLDELGSCGTLLFVNGTLYGPALLPSGSMLTTPWTPVSQSAVTGTGSSADPYRIVTTVDASGSGLRIVQTDSYVLGTQQYRTDVEITNSGSIAQTGTLYRVGDCYLQGSDIGFGRVDRGAPACIASTASSGRIEQWTPITPGSHYMEDYYGYVYAAVNGQQLPDTCPCRYGELDAVDNGAGLSWAVSVSPGQSATFSHDTFFSPTGRAPATGSFTQSVPDPTQIATDPIVVATTALITAGVILLVPFPSALFNSTLEENYDEVMAGVGRISRRVRSWWAALVGWLRSKRANRGADAAPAASDGTVQGPPTAYVDPMHPLGGPLPGQAIPLQPQLPPAPGPEFAPRPTALVQPSTSDVWRTPPGILGFVVLSAVFYSFLDPTFGISLTSIATFLGLAVGLLVILAAYGTPLLLFSRTHSIGLDVRALPATLIIAVICVLVSRLASFQPGYMYGLIIGFFFAHSVSRDVEGKAEAAAAAASLIAAFVAWVLLAFLRSGGSVDEFTNALLQAATVTVVVAGLENAVFAMLPLRFMPGAAVFSWNRIVWATLLGFGVFGFAHVLLNPTNGAGYLADTTRTSFVTLVLLLAAFGLASVLFWAWFRFRPNAHRKEGPAL